ncbi:DUF4296 domain-containing protein [Rufibacter roseolus]|uniref:DUF4296 domain-containing protein n=1 Tax=Rufibacter roseolus TaxID=2817375 RepID=UPI001B314BE0|nr:DUF4296 domain-containing protein [Rufibacter roseolus]
MLPLALLSCTPEPEKPADLIPEEKMTRIMIDVHLTEAAIGRTIHHFDSSRVAYREAHKLILKRQGVTDSAFKHSYDYYLSDPAKMDKIYEAVLDSLSLREAKLTKAGAQEAPQPVAPPTPSPDTAKAKTLQKFKRLPLVDSLKARQQRARKMIK